MHKIVQKTFPRRPILGIFLSLAIVTEVAMVVYADAGGPGRPDNPTGLQLTSQLNGVCTYEYQTEGKCLYFTPCSKTCAESTRVKRWFHSVNYAGNCGSATNADPVTESGWVASQTSGTIKWGVDITTPEN